MATIAKSGTPSLASVEPPANNRVNGLYAGEAIGAFDACYIKSTDGKVWRTNGTSANAAAKVRGFAARAANAGEPITLYHGVVVNYGSGLTPGAGYYASATAGQLDDAATTGGTGEVAFAIDATRIYVKTSGY